MDRSLAKLSSARDSSRGAGSRRWAGLAIRLMIIDDSLIARTVLKRMAEADGDLEVTAVAGNAESAIAALDAVHVDVILLDLEMPGTGGLEALPRIIAAARGARILVVSSLTVDGAEQTLAALSLGAADTLAKPAAGGFDERYRELLIGKIRALGVSAGRPMQASARRAALPPPAAAVGAPARKPAEVLAIGASTGGIHALSQLFAGIPHRLGVPVLVTQHLPASFMAVFARQLRMASGCEALVAEEDMLLVPDRILVAPGDAHITVFRKAGRMRIKLDRTPQSSGCTPSVDPMFSSLADCFGEYALGVVLSGMGRDGAEGAARLVAAGGAVYAQDEASSAVWGMPRVVAEAGLAAEVLPPEAIAARVIAGVETRACR